MEFNIKNKEFVKMVVFQLYFSCKNVKVLLIGLGKREVFEKI